MSSQDTKLNTNVDSDLGRNQQKNSSSSDGLTLRPIHDAKALKAAVLNTIERMEENGNTHEYCLYILRALNDPDIIYQDIEFLDNKAKIVRHRRETSLRIKNYMITAMGLLVSVACSALVGWLVSRIP